MFLLFPPCRTWSLYSERLGPVIMLVVFYFKAVTGGMIGLMMLI